MAALVEMASGTNYEVKVYGRHGTIINVREAAELLRVSTAQVRLLVRKGALEKTAYGRYFMVTHDAMASYLIERIDKLNSMVREVNSARSKKENGAKNSDRRGQDNHNGD